MTKMAILQEVDKCMRCNGCVVACKREWKMKQETIGVMKVAYDQRLAIKSQRRTDMGPFMRFTCWHCPDPPCAKRCPKKAIEKKDNGAVNVDYALCDPTVCVNAFGQYPCVVDCQRGGYPKIGVGSDLPAAAGLPKAHKCTLCSGRAGEAADLDSTMPPLPTRATDAEVTAVPGKAHEPACVSSCPAKAMKWDTQANIVAYLRDPLNGYTSVQGSQGWVGNGAIYWASRTELLAPPKADPFVEDHLSPLASSLFSNPLAKAAIVPTLLIGGLMALSARRTANEEEVSA